MKVAKRIFFCMIYRLKNRTIWPLWQINCHGCHITAAAAFSRNIVLYSSGCRRQHNSGCIPSTLRSSRSTFSSAFRYLRELQRRRHCPQTAAANCKIEVFDGAPPNLKRSFKNLIFSWSCKRCFYIYERLIVDKLILFHKIYFSFFSENPYNGFEINWEILNYLNSNL